MGSFCANHPEDSLVIVSGPDITGSAGELIARERKAFDAAIVEQVGEGWGVDHAGTPTLPQSRDSRSL